MIEELYKKKIIRDFLSLFSESKWKELLFLSIEYGIILLKRNYNVASLSLDDLNTILDDLKEEETKRLRQNMKKYEKDPGNDRSGAKSNLVTKPSSNWRKGDETNFEQVRHNSKPKAIDFDFDKKIGKTTLEKILKSKNDKTNIVNYENIYPVWWGDANKKSLNNYNKTVKSI